MAIALKFEKPDNQTQWGFRLVGGADFETPLVVVKVNENSLSEKLGLEEGDIIVRINNTSTAGLTHIEAHELLLRAGNEFELGIRRGDILYYQQWVNDIQNNVEVSEILKSTLQAEGDHEQLMQMINEQNIEKETIKSHHEDESSISENLSGQEQIIDPLKPVKEGKKWSTFLQKPNKPLILSKKEEELKKSQSAPYRVVIKKQKRRGGPRKVQFEEPELEIKEIESTTLEETTVTTEEHNQEQTEIKESEIEVELKVTEKEEVDICIEEGDASEDNIESRYEVEEVEEVITKVESETICESSLTLEEQLLQVQRQLQALSAIPSEIQVTLDAVTQQLAQIVGVKAQEEEKEENNEEDNEKEEGSIPDNDKAEGDLTDEENNIENQNEDNQAQEEPEENKETPEEQPQEEPEPEPEPEPEDTMTEEEKEAIRIEQERQAKKQKVNHWNQVWPWSDVTKPVYRESNCHLVPSKAIASNRINFLKYTPPPKNLDYLQRSEVYKLIHDQEPPVRGISTRIEKILSEQDYVSHGEP